ncbi:hypothetical protein F5884DRAFT_720005 [Xylogone sp. PMI_703]|nr:hypothetical protein F5884DRAFT_720005 [Xylogone sp. PMI_703]
MADSGFGQAQLLENLAGWHGRHGFLGAANTTKMDAAENQQPATSMGKPNNKSANATKEPEVDPSATCQELSESKEDSLKDGSINITSQRSNEDNDQKQDSSDTDGEKTPPTDSSSHEENQTTPNEPREKIKPEDPKEMKVQVWRVDDIYNDETDERTICPYDPHRSTGDVDQSEAILSPDKCDSSILVIRRIFNKDDGLRRTALDMRSPLIRNVVKNTVKSEVAYLETGSSVTWPHDGLFRYRDSIRKFASEQGDELTITHVNVLLDLINTEFATKIESINTMFSKGVSSFDILREAFWPGDIIVDTSNDYIRAYRVKSADYEERWTPRGMEVYLAIKAEYTDSDGDVFGNMDTTFTIDGFKGVTFFNELNVFPLKYHPNSDEVFNTLVNRGKRFASLKGQHLKFLKGVVWDLRGSKMTVNSRIVLDTVTFNRLNPNWEVTVAKLDRELTEEDLALCSDRVRFFSLYDKDWFIGHIGLVEDVTFKQDVFDRLVLNEDVKYLTRVLVQQHIKGRDFDDFIEGKGKGIVILLHGPPGVGKTLTAEAVAEYTKRPLYTVTSGELGARPEMLEGRLKTVLDIANTFGAVLLLDEADVFLERRDTHDLERNALVSIFLRLLEYYQGILFLTTNRIRTFDEAFHSRIHITLSYPDLSIEARKKIWANFAQQSAQDVDLSDDDYTELAKSELNGRQIKNAFSSAAAVAAEKQEPLSIKHFKLVVDILNNSTISSLMLKS